MGEKSGTGSLRLRRCLSIMRETHVNPTVSGFDGALRGDYEVRS
jgi:hypothetical protein